MQVSGVAHHEIAVEQFFGRRFVVHGDSDRSAVLDARETLSQAQGHAHVPAGLLDDGRQLGLIMRHVDGALRALTRIASRCGWSLSVRSRVSRNTANRSIGMPKPPEIRLKPR